MGAVVILGRIFTGLFLLAWALGWVAWHWFTGAPFRHNYRGRRYLSRPVRATAQTVPVLVAIAWWLYPTATIWVTGSVVLALFGTAGAFRVRLWLDAREAAKPVLRAKVKMGEPIRPEEPPIDVEVLELPTRDRAATTRRLVRELEAAR